MLHIAQVSVIALAALVVRMWLAPVVEAAPAMRTSASQKIEICRAASKSAYRRPRTPARLVWRMGGRRQKLFDRQTLCSPQSFDFGSQLGNDWDLRREQDGSIEVKHRQAVAIVEAVFCAEFRWEGHSPALANLHCGCSHMREFRRNTEFLQIRDPIESDFDERAIFRRSCNSDVIGGRNVFLAAGTTNTQFDWSRFFAGGWAPPR